MASQLAAGLWQFELGLVPPLKSNAYLIDDSDGHPLGGAADGDSDGETGITLVDTGLFWNLRSIRAEVTAAGYDLDDVDRVLLTHYDLDHTGGLSSVTADSTASVYLGTADARLAAGETDPNAFHHKGLFHRLARRLAPLPAGITVEHVSDGDRIGQFTAFHTPGHNPGHTVYVHDAGVAFLGDLVWEEAGELTPPFWLDSYDMRQVRESIRQFADRAPAFELACMGHGSPLTADGSAALQRLADRV